MSKQSKTKKELVGEIEELRTRLEEAEEALRAIRSGEVDALVISSENGEQIYTLQSAEHPYRIMVETMNEGTATLIDNGTVLYCNRRLAEMLKTPLEAIIGSSILRFIISDHVDMFEALLEKGKRGSSKEEVTLQCEDGTLTPVQLSMSVLHGVQGVCVVVTDLTEQKRNNEALESEIAERNQVEEALKRMSHQMELILNSAGEGICGLDIDGNITFTNPSGVKMIGWKAEEIIGKSMHDIMHHSRPDGTRYQLEECPIYKSLKNGSTYHVDNEVFWRKDREGFPVEYISTPIQEGDRVVGVVVTFSDITERKKMEEERLKFSKLESVGILAGGIAHDFNNLLTGILTTISSAKIGSQVSADAYENLTEAEKACIQAKRLTQQLLTFSKGGALVKKLTSIERIIRESVSLALRGSNVKCNISIEEDLWDAEIDQGQISQAITNLLINADQAMPQGGLINVTARNIDYRGDGLTLKEERYARITVEDEGMGIPQEHIARIFDPYFTTKQKGSGLGLAVAYSIIKNHNGYIDIESQLGRGTKFYVYIPASPRRVEEERVEQKKTLSGKGRVLIMDDERIIRTAAGRALGRIGYEVEYAKDGAEAIELYTRAKDESRPFDVVIMDLTVPGGMGGKEAIEKLISVDPDVRAIVSSGYSNDSVMSEYRRYGFRGVLSKPYSIEELTDMLHKVMEEKVYPVNEFAVQPS